MRTWIFILLAGGLAAALSAQENMEKLRQAAEKEPTSIPARAELVDALLRDEQFGEAEAQARAGLEKNPNAAGLHRALGDVLFRSGHIFEADNEYRTAYKTDSKNARALYGVGLAAEAGCLRKDAKTYIQGAHKIDPNDPMLAEMSDEWDGDSPQKIAGWEKQLEGEKKDSSYARYLSRRIARAKALNGKPAFELATPYQHYDVPLTALMNGTRPYAVGITVAIDGNKSRLELDTGASGVVLSSGFAERAGVRRLADIEVHGIGNEAPRKAWLGFVDSLSVGGLEFRICIVEVADRGSVSDSGGLIGTDILRRFMVKIDFRARKVELDPLPGPAWDGVTAVNRYNGPELQQFSQVLILGHDLLIPGKLIDPKIRDAVSGLFLVDSGSGLSMVSAKIARNVAKIRDSEDMRVKGISGNVKKVYEANHLWLQFATFRQENNDMTAFDLTNISRGSGTEVMGILGLPILAIFKSVTIDYRDGRILFEKGS